MNNPKSTMSIIVSFLLLAYQLLTENAEILGIDGKTLTIVSLIVTFISLAWKQVNPEESVFSMVAKHIGIRPKKPRG